MSSIQERSLTRAGLTDGVVAPPTKFDSLSLVRDTHLRPSTESKPVVFDDDLAGLVRSIVSARAERFKYFPQSLFADPAWDILLELARAEQDQRRVTLTQLYTCTHVPSSTAARWIKNLTEEGWLTRRDCPFDARVKYIELSRDASAKMRDYLLRLPDLGGA